MRFRPPYPLPFPPQELSVAFFIQFGGFLVAISEKYSQKPCFLFSFRFPLVLILLSLVILFQRLYSSPNSLNFKILIEINSFLQNY